MALRPDGGLSLRLAGCPDWTLPDLPDFREDPFRAVPSRAVPWRLAYQSLTWLPALAEAAPARALALALAWSRANPWGQPADPLSLHPARSRPGPRCGSGSSRFRAPGRRRRS